MQTRATPGRVGHREVVAGLQRALVVQLDLAADVEHERAVGGVEHARARDRVDGVGQPRPVGGVAGLDGDVADRVGVRRPGRGRRRRSCRRPRRSRCATLPSIPGRWSISTRRVRLYWALGVVAIALAPSYASTGRPAARALDAPLAQIASDEHGRRALPDRRQQPRLPGVLRAAGVDRDLDRGAHQRDLRLRLDAGQDPHRLRAQGHGRRLGRRARAGARRSTPSTRPSAPAARICSRSSGRTWSRWSTPSATATSGSTATRPTT